MLMRSRVFAQVIKFKVALDAINASALIKTHFNASRGFLFARIARIGMIYESDLRAEFTLPYRILSKHFALNKAELTRIELETRPKVEQYLKQQGRNAKFNSLCKRSSNLIIQLCVNIMQFSDPRTQSFACIQLSFLGQSLPCDACNAIVLLFLCLV